MKITEISFSDNASKRIYNNYLKQVKKTIKSLSIREQNEILLEINSHIYEAMLRKEDLNEVEALLDVLNNLGEPDDVFKPLVADKILDKATRSFNPIHLFKALILNITNGISYLFSFLLYLLLFGFVFLIYAKITKPNQVGLLFENNQFLALGKLNSEYLSNPSYKEVLGDWFIPAMLISILVFYALITLLLKIKRTINKKINYENSYNEYSIHSMDSN